MPIYKLKIKMDDIYHPLQAVSIPPRGGLALALAILLLRNSTTKSTKIHEKVRQSDGGE
jgi:hypothetical protein